LHNVDGESEIDDPNFFFAKNGKYNAKDELDATIDALLNEKVFDDNSAACRFPARKEWLKEQLNITNFAQVTCREYDKVFKRVNPKSATLIFPSAHINSPASMFGHTFLRIDSAYKSKLLSYAVNYAADANTATENGFVFAIKGLFGGYMGKYSLLPYYDKLKEYRDSEQRDIWEYDLDLNEEEVKRMFRHIWELNGTQSQYYFFTENCSYNILWFIEVARPSIHLRDHFRYQVIPIATVHVAKDEGILTKNNYRPSRRTTILAYENTIDKRYHDTTLNLVNEKIQIDDVLNNNSIYSQQKIYIFEAAIELVEYKFSKNKIKKEDYLKLFHKLSKARASLGISDSIEIKKPKNPIDGHRDVRVSASLGARDDKFVQMIGIRPAYQDLKDSNYGFLQGTQIEFLNFLFSNTAEDDLKVEEATLISIASIAKRSDFFKPYSWRTKIGWDRKYTDDTSHFIATVGGGLSWGNDYGYVYMMIDPLLYTKDTITTGIGGSIGLAFEKYYWINTNIEATHRFYETGDKQLIIEATQGFRASQNIQIQINYDYKERVLKDKNDEQTIRLTLNYYF